MAVNNLNTGVGIQPTIVDAKGDLIAATANDAVNRLAVGTNGHVLVADSGETTGLKWNNPGSVGGLVHINTTAVSGAVSHSFGSNANPIFTSAFRNYQIILENIKVATSDQSIFLRMRENTSDLATAAYGFQSVSVSSTTVSGERLGSQTSINIGRAGVGDPPGSIITLLTNPQTAVFPNLISHCFQHATGTGAIIRDSYGFVFSSTSFNGFTIFAGTNISCTVSVYGYGL